MAMLILNSALKIVALIGLVFGDKCDHVTSEDDCTKSLIPLQQVPGEFDQAKMEKACGLLPAVELCVDNLISCQHLGSDKKSQVLWDVVKVDMQYICGEGSISQDVLRSRTFSCLNKMDVVTSIGECNKRLASSSGDMCNAIDADVTCMKNAAAQCGDKAKAVMGTIAQLTVDKTLEDLGVDCTGANRYIMIGGAVGGFVLLAVVVLCLGVGCSRRRRSHNVRDDQHSAVIKNDYLGNNYPPPPYA